MRKTNGEVEKISRKWYEELYDNAGRSYDKESFVQGTEAEVDFIAQELKHDRSLKILDVGCGTGRHCLELARRGYNVTGLDLSSSLLKRAREKAAEEGLDIEFIQGDARKMSFSRQFDLVMIICQGAFSLMEEDEMDYEILRGVSRALKDEGKFIMTTGNALYQLSNLPDDGSFDVLTLRETFTLKAEDDEGNKKQLNCTQRYYLPTELNWWLKQLGFTKIEFFGCGEKFSRERILTQHDFEMLVVAEK